VYFRFDGEKAIHSLLFGKLMNEYGVKLYSTYSPNKSMIVERVNRQIQFKLQKLFTQQGRDRWVDAIKDIEYAINNEYHSSINRTPLQVNETNSGEVWQYMHDKLIKGLKHMKPPELKINDVVRISQKRLILKKASSSANYSSEQFKISAVKYRPPIWMYSLVDLKGNKVDGTFRAHDLLLIPK
jgi:hypothetical protein